MDDHSYAMPPSYYSQPMAPWIPMEEYSMDTAHGLEDRSLPQDLASFPPTQLHSSHAVNVYPSLPVGAERMLEYHPFPQEQPLSFPPTNGFPAGDPSNIKRVNSDPEVEDVESDLEHMYSDSKSQREDSPLPADAARWISMSPTEFDREYPGGNPFAIEELNFGSEEDAQNASYVELGASAHKRIFIIFLAVELAIFPNGITDIQREIIWGIVAGLLKDGQTWLWVDGDEEQCCDLHHHDAYVKKSLEYVKRKLSCSSLWLRKPRLPTWTSLWERVSKASFAIRVSVITWATFTSVSVREAGWVRGRADWTRCALLSAACRWHGLVLWELGMVDLLRDESRHSHLEVAFKDTLRSHGHSCCSSLPEYLEEPLKRWLYLQSFLHSTPGSGKDVSMILFESDEELSCQQCAKLKELYSSSKTINDARYTPPLSLLVLDDFRVSLDIDTTAWLKILAVSVSRGMISAAMLSKMDDNIQMGPFDFDYQPWLNRLPTISLRHSVVTYSESEWREAEHAIRRATQHESAPTSRWDSPDIGLRVQITAFYLLVSEHSSQKLTPYKYWIDCYRWAAWEAMFDHPVYPPHIAASISELIHVQVVNSDGMKSHWWLDNAMLQPTFCFIQNRSMYHNWNRFDVRFATMTGIYRKLEAEPAVPTQLTASDATIPPEDMDSDSKDYPLPADVARRISMSPASTGAQKPDVSVAYEIVSSEQHGY
ncbi:hypothetical protein BDZ89DRAFT_1226793 [Hymenopellis radicata]|nr:hypothetical protein BDZ89DRAFT_1226793 [Hymenopellis radicata]